MNAKEIQKPFDLDDICSYSLTFIVTSMRRCEASQCTNILLAADALKPTISPHCDIAQYSTVSISRDAASSDKAS